MLCSILGFCCLFIQNEYLKEVRLAVNALLVQGITRAGTASWLGVPDFLLFILSKIVQCVAGPRQDGPSARFNSSSRYAPEKGAGTPADAFNLGYWS